jgi:hypothetical protein
MSINRQYSFWGSLSPLGGLTGAGLLIMASARLSWAIIVSGSLLWVYALTTLTFSFLVSLTGKGFFPVRGRKSLFVCLGSFWGSVYLLMFWLLSPFAALETFVLLLLVPLFCASSGIIEQLSLSENAHPDIFEQVSDSVSQAAALSGLMIVFSVIREPFSYCSLSFPGSYQGMITIMYFKAGAFFPIGIFASSAGALLLLGFFVCLYQYYKGFILPGDNV